MKKDITGEDVIDARLASGDVCNRVLSIMRRANQGKRKFLRRFRKDSKKQGGAA